MLETEAHKVLVSLGRQQADTLITPRSGASINRSSEQIGAGGGELFRSDAPVLPEENRQDSAADFTRSSSILRSFYIWRG
ncbi:hypothetical protein GCM10008957_14910 [Deinococcus ruber]|uniref:Uncharacterized protein n=1 Tax=Deinococcus ruber TaxID=1848197 RepID=A0A918F374_9DEIO|nr:hypothetical protein GCM10008957_14910 [Deinococcus ruber]